MPKSTASLSNSTQSPARPSKPQKRLNINVGKGLVNAQVRTQSPLPEALTHAERNDGLMSELAKLNDPDLVGDYDTLNINCFKDYSKLPKTRSVVRWLSNMS